jgi:N-acetylglucosamine kinase-like BadF-type ATPase
MVLNTIFTIAEIDVKSDLLAVAHALLHNNSGVVGILGTGSNVAYFDAENIKPVKTSLGYLLGDEGSGNQIGKQFLKLYLTDSLDADLDKEIELDKDSILKELYEHSFPNRYLASFCEMLFPHRSHPQIAKIISDAFEEWIRVYLLPHNIMKIHLCGSIAYYFSTELKACCSKHGITIESIVEKPISALTLYHLENQ